MARRLLVVVLAYEGRTLKQIADWLGLREHIVSGLVRAFIRNGHHGLALQARFGRPPYNSSYGASRVQRLADAAQNEAYRIRLEIISAAYRGVPWRDIGETYGTSYRQVEKFVRLFEADGPVALSYGEALLTPSLRSDYDGKLLRKLAGMESDPTVSLKIASIARLYDGETMYDVAKSVRHVGTLSVWLSSFQREGHTFAAPFEWLTQTPLAPPSRLPALREDLAADVIRPYAESATRSSARRLGAVLDYATGMNQSILLEKWQVSFTNMKRWIIEANQAGLAWFYSAQPKEWLRKHSADLLATGITPVDVATRLGKSTGFVLESATAMPEVEAILGEYANDVSIMGQVRLAMRSHLEPLASYAKVVSLILSSYSPEHVMAKWELDPSSLRKILTAFRENGVAGLASDPLNLVSTDGAPRGRIAKVGHDPRLSPVTVPVYERIRSYIKLAPTNSYRALRTIAQAAAGAPMSVLLQSSGVEPGVIRGWVEQYNAGGSSEFIEAKHDYVDRSGFHDSAGSLFKIAGAIPNKVLARNVRIVATVASGFTPSYACDLHGATHSFVTACLEGYKSDGIAGLATISRRFIEMKRADAVATETADHVHLKEDVEISYDDKSNRVLTWKGRVEDGPERKAKRSHVSKVEAHAAARRVVKPLQLHRDVAIHYPQTPDHHPHMLVAMTKNAILFKDAVAALEALPAALQEARRFGTPGVILVGLDSDGDDHWTIEETIGGDEDFPTAAFVRALSEKIEAEAIPAISRAEEPWRIVPFFSAPAIDEPRKLRALQSSVDNRDFVLHDGDATVRLWAPASVVMASADGHWHVSEATLRRNLGHPAEIYDILAS